MNSRSECLVCPQSLVLHEVFHYFAVGDLTDHVSPSLSVCLSVCLSMCVFLSAGSVSSALSP